MIMGAFRFGFAPPKPSRGTIHPENPHGVAIGSFQTEGADRAWQSWPTNSGNQSYPLFVACISFSDGRSSDFPLHPVFFPTADFLSAERFGVEVVVSRISVGGPGIVRFFAHPSLACNN
jgi:hypothetical protein